MKNKYIKGARVSERKFREVLKCFARDVSVLTTAKLCGLNCRTAHRLL
jgi:transposase